MVKTAAFVILQRDAFGRAQAGIGEKPVGAFLMDIGHGGPIQLFRNEHGGFAFTGMQYDEGTDTRRSGEITKHDRRTPCVTTPLPFCVKS